MQTTQANLIQSMRLVQAFLQAHTAQLEDVVSTGARNRFEQALAKLESHKQAQNAHDREIVAAAAAKLASKAALLRKHMRPIASVAKLELRDRPEFKALRMPQSRLSLARLIATAQGMAGAAVPYQETFLAAGLPADFLDRLLEAASAVQSMADAKGVARTLRRKATAGLYKDALKGRATVNVLDAMITAKLPDDDVLLDQWKSTCRVVRSATPKSAAEASDIESGAELSAAA